MGLGSLLKKVPWGKIPWQRILAVVIRKVAKKKTSRMDAVAPIVSSVRGAVAEDYYDFYRCVACHRVITRLEEIEFTDPESKRYGKPCKCGSLRFSPIDWTYLSLREKALPRVLWFALVRLAGIA